MVLTNGIMELELLLSNELYMFYILPLFISNRVVFQLVSSYC